MRPTHHRVTTALKHARALRPNYRNGGLPPIIYQDAGPNADAEIQAKIAALTATGFYDPEIPYVVMLFQIGDKP